LQHNINTLLIHQSWLSPWSLLLVRTNNQVLLVYAYDLHCETLIIREKITRVQDFSFFSTKEGQSPQDFSNYSPLLHPFQIT